MFDIIGKRKWFFLFSGLILVPGLIAILLTPLTGGKAGLQFSIDYTGGTVWEFAFKDTSVTADQVKTVLIQNGLGEADVTSIGNGVLRMRTSRTDLLPVAKSTPTPVRTAAPSLTPTTSAGPTPTSTPSPTASPTATANGSASASALPSATASPTAAPSASPSASATPVPTATPVPSPSAHPAIAGTSCIAPAQIPPAGELAQMAKVLQSKLGPIQCTGMESTVGPIISAQLIQDAVVLIFFGGIGILLWITIRFHDYKMGATALASLLHDVIVVVGIFAILGTLFKVEIDALFVTAMLTIIGFSVHDTIVVFDRIRENKARHAGEPFDQIVNHSILQTFGRSINTSMTVVITLSALLLFAGASIKYFVLALLIGIISGTYSSVFNASPLLVVWQLWEDRRRAAQLALARTGRRSRP